MKAFERVFGWALAVCASVLFACGGGNGEQPDAGQWKPANPADIATPVDVGVDYDIFDDNRFLWEDGAVVRDLDPAVLQPHRFVVLRGRVLDETGAGLESEMSAT
ncbi:MAG: hypothetical protein D6806_07155 [Deltaproteobacteria bacterium]|nr:MAG: hypothetical protein D6806_07155 [Deltaproteobacteria bacterium]